MDFRTSRDALLRHIDEILQWRFTSAEVPDGSCVWGGVEQLLIGQDALFCMRVGRVAWGHERRLYMSYPLPRPMWINRRLVYSYALHYFHDLANCTQIERDNRLREVIAIGGAAQAG